MLMRRIELADASPAEVSAVADRSPVPDRAVRAQAAAIVDEIRRDGDEAGLKKTVEVIRSSGADVVCMQETYGSGAAIAYALGFTLYLRSSNLSVMCRYPLGRTFDF